MPEAAIAIVILRSEREGVRGVLVEADIDRERAGARGGIYAYTEGVRERGRDIATNITDSEGR